jgi:hypothetical protein
VAATTYLAAGSDLFEREGLDVDVKYVSGVGAVNAVIADFAHGARQFRRRRRRIAGQDDARRARA